MASALISKLIRYKEEGFRPDRDIIVALDADEEILDRDGYGISWLIKNQRPLIDAEFALNEGGGVGVKNGKTIRNSVQTGEKIDELASRSEGPRRTQRGRTARQRHLSLGRRPFEAFEIRLSGKAQRGDARLCRANAATEQGDVASAIAALLAGRNDAASINH